MERIVFAPYGYLGSAGLVDQPDGRVSEPFEARMRQVLRVLATGVRIGRVVMGSHTEVFPETLRLMHLDLLRTPSDR